MVAFLVKFMIVLLGRHKGLRALLSNLSELVLAVIFFVSKQFLVTSRVRLIPSLIENELSVLLHGD